jgi:HEAT repeat protein
VYTAREFIEICLFETETKHEIVCGVADMSIVEQNQLIADLHTELENKDNLVVWAVLEILCNIGELSFVDPVIAVMNKSDNALVCAMAFRALLSLLSRNKSDGEMFKSSADKIIPVAIEKLSDSHAIVAVAAARLLGGVGGNDARIAMMKALSSHHPSVRSAAAESLGNISDYKEAGTTLLELGDTETNVDVRESAYEAAHKLYQKYYLSS